MKNLTAKLFALGLVFLLGTNFLIAQVDKGLKLIEKNNFPAAEMAIKKDLNSAKYGAMALYGLAKLYATVGYSAYNLDSAYQLITRAKLTLKKMNYKTKEKLRKKFSSSHLKKQKNDIVKKAFTQAEETETLAGWNHFINFYKKPSRKYEKKAALARNKIAFATAQKGDKWTDYADIFTKYGQSMKKRSPGLYKKTALALLNKYIGEKSWSSYPTFAEKFPTNTYVKKNVIGELDSIVLLKKPALLFDFTARYKNTVFAKKSVDSLAQKLPKYGRFVDCQKFLSTYKNHNNSDAVWERLYFAYAAKAKPTVESINSFKERFPEYPFPNQLEEERQKIADKMYPRLMEAGTLRGLKNFLTQFPKHENSTAVWTKYYEMYRLNYPTFDQLEGFEERNPNFPFTDRLKKDKVSLLDKKATLVLASDEIYVLKAFIETHPKHSKVPNVWKKWYSIVKEKSTKWEFLDNFKQRNPEYPDIAQIDNDIAIIKKNEEKADFETLTPSSSLKDYYDYLDKYPTSAFTANVETAISKKVVVSDNEMDFKRFLNKFPTGKHKNEVAKKLYQRIAKNGSREDIENFAKKFPNLIPKEQIEKDIKVIKIKGYEVSVYHQSKKATFELYIQQNAPKQKAFNALRKMVDKDLKDKKYVAAVKTMTAFKTDFGDDKNYNKLHKILTEKEQKVNALSISEHVNTKKYAEFSPIISADGQTLYFCKTHIKNYDENIFISQRKNGVWESAVPVTIFAKKTSHESPQALSADGNDLILFKNGTLYTSTKKTTGWSKPIALPNTINIGKWQADARITADNKAIIFASGSNSYAEDIDIYISVKDENGEWGQAYSLGKTINTQKADRAPFLHPDMTTMYFSSRGHVGLGQADIFMSKRLDDTWTNWSEPVNMGKSLNSTGVEFEFKVTTDGTKAYFSKENGARNFDIFIADLPQAYRPEKVTTILGTIKGIDGTPIGAEIVWEDLKTGKVIQTTSSDPVTGDFFATLPPQKGKIGYTIQHEGHIPLSGHIDVSKEDAKNIVLEEPMVIVSIEEMKKTGFKFELNNLFFETAKFNIKSTSYPELNRLAEWMKTYKLTIEILGHTDNVGETTANQQLSENRANAVRKYLIKKGCIAANISTQGFGETTPVKSNDNLEGRARNRRVEIRLRE